MKITSTTANHPSAPAASVGKQRAATSPAAAPAAPAETVALTAPTLGGASGGEVPFDAAKVEAIREAITQGRFKVDVDKIASELIDTVTGLLKK